MPGYALSEIFRAKMHASLTRAGLGLDLDPTVWQRAWTVHIQQIGRGQHAVRYLSRYVYRVALSNHSLERFDNQNVTFRYTHARFLQHVLPRGFSKVRSYGLLSPSRRPHLERARQLLERHNAATHSTTVTAAAAPATASASPVSMPASSPAPCCTACQQPTLRFVQRLPHSRAPP